MNNIKTKSIYRFIGLRSSQLFAWVSGICIALMALSTFVTVVLRKTPLSGSWLTGTIDLVEISFAMATVFSLSYTWFLGGHLRIGFVRDNVKPVLRNIIDAFGVLSGLVWITFGIWGLWGVSLRSMESHASTILAHIPVGPFQIAFLILLAHFWLVLAGALIIYIGNAFGKDWKDNIDPQGKWEEKP